MVSDGVTVIIPRKENKNIVLISEKEYQALEKAVRNSEYLKMLDESDKQLREGRTVVRTMEELEKMENE